MTENPPWRRFCSALRNHPTALPALSVTQFAHADELDLSEEHGRCGADVVAVLLCTGKAPLPCCSSPLKPAVKCLQSCWRCRCWVAPCYCRNYEFYRHLLELCWYGQSLLRLLLLCALPLHTPSGEVALGLVSQGMPFP